MTTPPSKRRALGRGLSALIPGPAAARAEETAPSAADDSPPPPQPTIARREFFHAAIEEIYPSPDQPRKRFSDEELEELAQSIRAHGVIQPLIVRTRDDGGYHLIAGERRWRASQRAGLQRVPVVVQDVAPREAFERALVENLQRSDLNAIEEAEGYRRLVEEHGYSQEQVAERVGKDRSTVANSLRLLRLPAHVRRMVEDKELSMGHAKALLMLESDAEMETLARAVLGRKLSVRATEEAARKRNAERSGPPAQPQPPQKSASVRDLENRLMQSLGARIQISEDKSGKGGTIEIRYIDLDDLDRLLARLLS